MNVAPGDLAVLVRAKYPENQFKLCTVEKAIPRVDYYADKEPHWFVRFPSPVRTDAFEQYGKIPFASIADSALRRIAGPSVDITEVDDLEIPA